MKTLSGKIVSMKQNKTAIVEIVRSVAHPKYRKLLTKTKKYQVDTAGFTPKVEDEVIIIETRPISKNKVFKIKELKEYEAKEPKESKGKKV